MKISIVKPNSPNLDPWIPEFQRQGIDVLVNEINSDCNFLIGSTISQYNKIKQFHDQYPNIPMINYNWDMYEWIWKQPRTYNWKGYGELLKKSIEVWCPSEEVILRAEEFFGCGSNHKVIKTFARLFEYSGEVVDKRYIYQAMRNYELDKNYGWLRRACSELNIPLVESHHKLSESEFQKTIAECSFLVCDYHEASTGGLTLIEGYKLGKPVVVSNSKYMGARDYFGDRAIYFNDNSYIDFKNVINEIWNNTPKLSVTECREFTDQYTVDKMVSKMIERLNNLYK
jgi:glycosyltransferase involved in cell wall biosynthesis